LIRNGKLVSAVIFSYKDENSLLPMAKTTLGPDSKPTSISHFSGELEVRIDEIRDGQIVKQKFLDYDGKDLIRTRIKDLVSGEEEIVEEPKPEEPAPMTREGQYAFPIEEANPLSDSADRMSRRAKGIAAYLGNAEAKRERIKEESEHNKKLEEGPSSAEKGY
jgi:hypothetical protein